MTSLLNVLMFGPVLAAGLVLLQAPQRFVDWFNSCFDDFAGNQSQVPVAARDHSGRKRLRPEPFIVLPNSRNGRLAIRAAGLLLILFSAAHLAGVVR